MKGILNTILNLVSKYKPLLFIIAVGLHIFYYCNPNVLSNFLDSFFANTSAIMLLNWLLTFVTASSYMVYSFLKFLNMKEECELYIELRTYTLMDLKEIITTLIPLKYISTIIFFVALNKSFLYSLTFGLIPLLLYIIILLSFLRIITYIFNKQLNS